MDLKRLCVLLFFFENVFSDADAKFTGIRHLDHIDDNTDSGLTLYDELFNQIPEDDDDDDDLSVDASLKPANDLEPVFVSSYVLPDDLAADAARSALNVARAADAAAAANAALADVSHNMYLDGISASDIVDFDINSVAGSRLMQFFDFVANDCVPGTLDYINLDDLPPSSCDEDANSYVTSQNNGHGRRRQRVKQESEPLLFGEYANQLLTGAQHRVRHAPVRFEPADIRRRPTAGLKRMNKMRERANVGSASDIINVEDVSLINLASKPALKLNHSRPRPVNSLLALNYNSTPAFSSPSNPDSSLASTDDRTSTPAIAHSDVSS